MEYSTIQPDAPDALRLLPVHVPHLDTHDPKPYRFLSRVNSGTGQQHMINTEADLLLQAQQHEVLGVRILDVTRPQALQQIARLIESPRTEPCCIYFVNAHTLNIAYRNHDYRELLNTGRYVFGDGSGIRMACRMLHGITLQDNVNGSDLMPELLSSSLNSKPRYYLLGATDSAIEKAATHVRKAYPDWELCGYHHGYLHEELSSRVVESINKLEPDLLLVGMGNPMQEQWIARWSSDLKVKVCIGVGGLLRYWSGDITRAPEWMRNIGIEWIHLMLAQPRKTARYMIGNPAFLSRVLAQSRSTRTEKSPT